MTALSVIYYRRNLYHFVHILAMNSTYFWITKLKALLPIPWHLPRDQQLLYSISKITGLLFATEMEFTQVAKLMGSTWGPPRSWRPQLGPMLAPWILLSGKLPVIIKKCEKSKFVVITPGINWTGQCWSGNVWIEICCLIRLGIPVIKVGVVS